MRLAPRFYEPATAELLEELKAYQAVYDAEVQRVANVCAHFKKHVFAQRQPKLTTVKGARA